jgi:Sulfotransferase family
VTAAAGDTQDGWPGETQPIFVVGFRRSGTTLLQALVGSHPRIATPPEMHFFGRVWQHREAFGDLSDDEALRAVIRATIVPGWPPFDECEFDADAIFETLRTGPRTYAAVLDAVMRDFMVRHGKERWCEKTPWQRPALIWQHFPDARVVHILRDPRDVVASSLSMPSVWPDGASTARAWRAFTQRSLSDGVHKGPAHYLRIRYEDLTKDPVAVLRVVFAFLGEGFDPAIVDDTAQRRTAVPSMVRSLHGRVLESIEPAPEGQWRERLAPVDRLRLAPIVAPLLPGLAYERPRRTTVLAGLVLNAMHSPVDGVRRLGDWWRRRQLRTPEQRISAYREFSQERASHYRKQFDEHEQVERPAAAGHGA